MSSATTRALSCLDTLVSRVRVGAAASLAQVLRNEEQASGARRHRPRIAPLCATPRSDGAAPLPVTVMSKEEPRTKAPPKRIAPPVMAMSPSVTPMTAVMSVPMATVMPMATMPMAMATTDQFCQGCR